MCMIPLSLVTASLASRKTAPNCVSVVFPAKLITPCGAWTTLTNLDGDARGYTDAGTLGAVYVYRIAAFNTDAYSYWSDPAGAGRLGAPLLRSLPRLAPPFAGGLPSDPVTWLHQAVIASVAPELDQWMAGKLPDLLR